MVDVLIRNVTPEIIAALDAKAAKLGLSRTEFLRRVLERERATGVPAVTVDDLGELAALTHDLTDGEVMRSAWS